MAAPRPRAARPVAAQHEADRTHVERPRAASQTVRAALCAFSLAQLALLFSLSWARFENVHQRTFDLALYARIAWGLAHLDGWSPVLNSHVLGAHIAPVLWPLGLLGRLFGTVPALLFAQAAAVALTVWPLARIAQRRLGTQGVFYAAAAWGLYPNLGHVVTYEFHPGTLAVLPMMWAFDALDRGSLRALGLSCLGVLLCREDFGVFCALLCLAFFVTRRERRALGLLGAIAGYTIAALWVTSRYAPSDGSLSQHFGVWGGSPTGVFRVLFTDPARVWAHFGRPEKLLYLPQVLAPVGLLSLCKPLWLLPALPYLGLNMLSAFPTTHEQYSHYLTPAVVPLLASALVGLTELKFARLRVLFLVPLAVGHYVWGGLPLSRDFERAAFRADPATHAARAVLAAIPAGASVQAPDPLLPHLAERRVVRRAPPPEAGTEYVVLDVSHRLRYARREDLLRTLEEPGVRGWLARPDHGLLVYAPPYALLARGVEPRTAPAVRGYFAAKGASPEDPSAEEAQLTDCLALRGGRLAGAQLTLELRALGPCPADLALHLGPGPTPWRTELLFDGALSPAHLRAGDLLVTQYALSPKEVEAYRAQGLHVSVLRQSGARPRPEDPVAVRVVLGE